MLDRFQNYQRETILNYAQEKYSPEVVDLVQAAVHSAGGESYP